MTENKVDEYKYKKPVSANLEYFLEHAEEIIEETEHVLDPDVIKIIELKSHHHKEKNYLHWCIKAWRRNHVHHNMAFGRGKFYLSPGESELQAEYRMAHEYCEGTGHWDLFIWKDMPEDEKELFGI